jgi:hypothetical protein
MTTKRNADIKKDLGELLDKYNIPMGLFIFRDEESMNLLGSGNNLYDNAILDAMMKLLSETLDANKDSINQLGMQAVKRQEISDDIKRHMNPGPN